MTRAVNCMLNLDPTFLGTVASVSGASVGVHLAESVASGLSIVEGRVYKIGQVGSFVRIPQGYQDLFGVVSEVGASAVPKIAEFSIAESGRWMQLQLIGESMGGLFERGISQYPNIGDAVHLTTESSLSRIYSSNAAGQIVIGSLSSAESIPAKIALDELITRHSAILGSTGSGKSTTVASILRSIASESATTRFPSARMILLDVHGEYSSALEDLAEVFSVDPQPGQKQLNIPFWALDAATLLNFLTGGVGGTQEAAFVDKIFQLKKASFKLQNFSGLQLDSITVDTPIPFSLKQLWHDLIDIELMTFSDTDRSNPALEEKGNPSDLIAPKYTPHAMGAKGPFLNQSANGIRRQLDLLRSRLLDRRYSFLLQPGLWEPDLDGKIDQDLDVLLTNWIGGPKPITILDLSSVPNIVLERLIGSILNIVYDSLFWSREKSEGGINRPLLVVMEEAHRYLSSNADSQTTETVAKIAKEGRKYGVGAMIISQRPSEVNETILSQCGTYFTLRLTNPNDRNRIQGTLPDGLVSLLDTLPVLRTGEAIVTGEAVKLPMRCRITLPKEQHRPASSDPNVAQQWISKRINEGYNRVVASWRAQNPRTVVQELSINRTEVDSDQN